MLSFDQKVGVVKVLVNLDEFDFGEKWIVFFEGKADGTFWKVIFGISFQDVKVENLIGLGVFEGSEEGIRCLDVLVSLETRAIEFIYYRVQVRLLDFHLNKLSERLKILL